MSRTEVEISAEAQRAFRQLRPNEVKHIKNALETIKNEPRGSSVEYQVLSQREKFWIYRYRTPSGFILYNISKETHKVMITQIIAFKKKK
jgi:mRNA-degrading endonuclease RelE of RelBE toxin-antitoxin system